MWETEFFFFYRVETARFAVGSLFPRKSICQDKLHEIINTNRIRRTDASSVTRPKLFGKILCQIGRFVVADVRVTKRIAARKCISINTFCFFRPPWVTPRRDMIITYDRKNSSRTGLGLIDGPNTRKH